METDLIEKIRKELPESIGYMVLMSNGTVVQTDLDNVGNFNLPKMGENFLDLTDHIKKIFDTTPWNQETFRKQFITSTHYMIFYTKIDEFRNLVLFFIRSEDRSSRVALIHKILEIIETLLE